MRSSIRCSILFFFLCGVGRAQTTERYLPSEFGATLDSADVNGDGFGDVIVGDPRFTGTEILEGRVLVYHGSPTGPSASPSWSRVGAFPGLRLGLEVAGVGDVDGDGFEDAVVAAATPAGVGMIELYPGSPSGLRPLPLWRSRGTLPLDRFGKVVAGHGDFDGDGYDDFAVGAPGADGRFGSVALFYGSPSGPSDLADAVLRGPEMDAGYGTAVAVAGDVNGDGYDDLVIGAPDFGPLDQGRVWVHVGSASGLSATPSAWFSYGTPDFGAVVSGAGDFDGDGFDDVLISDPHGPTGSGGHGQELPDGGVVLILRGSATGAQAPQLFSQGPLSGSRYGIALASAGDVNGDGRGDVVSGEALDDYLYGGIGGVHVFSYGALPLHRLGTRPVAGFGSALATGVDVDGDGFDDVIVSEPGLGRVYVYRGSANGVEGSAAWTLHAPR